LKKRAGTPRIKARFQPNPYRAKLALTRG